VVTEYVSGYATHRFKGGKHEWSDELIRVDRITEACPDCDFFRETKQGENFPEGLADKISEARTLVDSPDPKSVQ
jgi:hypothetical protein